MTALLPPTIIPHQHVLKQPERSDSVGPCGGGWHSSHRDLTTDSLPIARKPQPRFPIKTLLHPNFGLKKNKKKKQMTWQLLICSVLTDEEAMGTVQSELILPGIVLTALFPYVIRFSMELILFVDGLCWISYTDWQHHISHHLSPRCARLFCAPR